MKSKFGIFKVRDLTAFLVLGVLGLPCQVQAAYTAGSPNDVVNKNLFLNDDTNNNLTAYGWGFFKAGIQFGSGRNVYFDFTPSPTSSSTATISFDTTRANGIFSWGDNYDASTLAVDEKMKLDNNNILSLYDSSHTATITLNPAVGQINLTGSASGIFSNGTAVFNISSSNTAVGASVLVNSTGTGNSALGFSALKNNTSGSNNVALGGNALISNISGGYNTASGVSALYSNTTGNNNSASGVNALYSNTTGSYNTASGVNALYSNTASSNAAFGYKALYTNTSGPSNAAFGANALYYNTTGGNNVALGYGAGQYFGSGSNLTVPQNSIYIGANSKGGPNGDDNNSIVIGASAVGEGANTTVIGTSSTTQTHLYGNTVANSLSVVGSTVLSGQVTLAAPQGDVSMGDYAN